MIDGQFVLNPMIDEMAKSDLDLVVAGTGDAVMMVESEAKELPEKQMLEAVMFGHRGFQPVIEAIIKLAEKAAKEPWDFQPPDKSKYKDKVKALVEADLRKAFATPEKQKRHELVEAASAKVKKELLARRRRCQRAGAAGFRVQGARAGRRARRHHQDQQRIDGRDLKTVRPIVSEVHVLPRTHGSALFTRGETQAIVVATLGTGEDEQFIDALEGTRKERFMLHYNFPPYSVGETGRMGSPGRREIGHGKLAWRAVHPLMPSPEEFPYTVRLVSEITESNGSSSMATVCGSSLALMDAGVPLKRPVAGIAMGLIKEGNSFAVLSDILGDEDHLGDMDFKVAGTEKGVTSLQMDIKITGITEEIMRVALDQANAGRMHILGEMAKAITRRAHRARRARAAHRDHQDPGRQDPRSDRLGRLGDPRDRGAERRQDRHRGRRHHQDRRLPSARRSRRRLARIKAITSEPEVGMIYKGKVVKIMEFGAFVNFFGKQDGLVHISQLTQGRPETVGEVVKEGQEVYVKLLGFDDRGKVRLSMKIVDQATGEEIPRPEGEPEEQFESRPPRRDRGGDRWWRSRAPARLSRAAHVRIDRTSRLSSSLCFEARRKSVQVLSLLDCHRRQLDLDGIALAVPIEVAEHDDGHQKRADHKRFDVGHGCSY